ncbi:MAG: DUF429 domain-containing protein [Acidobacteriia bacterium]|nr:DUF429 domain-containing protein [Terriglobia bacterium]
MPNEDFRRRSRWMIRALEWNDSRARYPNLWHEGMPCQILAFESMGSRLRLGDLIAVYHPASQTFPKRSERFVGISRVIGMRRARGAGSVWVDLETAHRFDPPLDLGEAPGRVFLCCDPGWPAREVSLFRRVLDAAVVAGFKPLAGETEAPAEAGHADETFVEESDRGIETERGAGEPTSATDLESDAHQTPMWTGPTPGARLFAGVDFSGDMRDPKDGTWLALLELKEERLAVVRLEATGRNGLEAQLRNPDAALLHAEAIGLDFPFGVPVPFAETLLGGPFPEEGWWALARKLERMSRPTYLIALQEFRDAHGELKRLTDESAGAFSPLHRVNPDLGPMTYQGIRMIAEERSRYALRPFESAKGRLLLEVFPGASLRRLGLEASGPGDRPHSIVDALSRAARLPVEIGQPFLRRCVARRDALDAVAAARCAALAVLSGETDRTPEDLAPGQGDRVRKEGWIYGLE